MKKIIFSALVMSVLSGCAQQNFAINSGNAVAPKSELTHNFFVRGVGQAKTIDAASVCGGADKVVRVEVQQTFVNVLLDVVTLGLYTPREARVYCSK
ncbi:Bor family protein [Aeromonas jandaei]|uniref:Bor family protein n=1 Tax=Aeromonas jandaei TaxID=650 RepID=UPI002AA0B97C|nr:Bor family protein [Aeromonas jandaei]